MISRGSARLLEGKREFIEPEERGRALVEILDSRPARALADSIERATAMGGPTAIAHGIAVQTGWDEKAVRRLLAGLLELRKVRG